MPSAKAAASGTSGASCHLIGLASLANSHVLAQCRELLWSQPQDAPEPFGGAEAAQALALFDNAPREARADAGQPRNLVDAGAVDVQRAGISGCGRW